MYRGSQRHGKKRYSCTVTTENLGLGDWIGVLTFSRESKFKIGLQCKFQGDKIEGAQGA